MENIRKETEQNKQYISRHFKFEFDLETTDEGRTEVLRIITDFIKNKDWAIRELYTEARPYI